jgi:hypothetical protein
MTTLAKFDFKQGFNRESTQYAEEGKWYDGNRVRFRSGKPENMRGYTKKVAASDTAVMPIVSGSFDGSARALLAWRDDENIRRALFATPDKVYEYNGGNIFDITPLVTTVELTSIFGTSAGSTRVCCSDGSHGAKKGDYVYFTSASVTIGSNILLNNKVFPITSIIDTNVFTFDASVTAAATSITSGRAKINYYLPTGTSVQTQGLGYGAGSYNAATPTSVGISKITATGSNALVTISCASAHGGAANDFIVFQNTSIDSIAATVGGNLNLTKPAAGGPQFSIVSVNGTQVIVSAAANASASGDVTSGFNMTALIYKQTSGSGSGRAWNAEATLGEGVNLDITQWSMDNWGEDVLINRRGGGIYYFEVDLSTSPVRATQVTTSPVSVNSLIVSPNDRHVIALGANQFEASATVSGAFNPMLVRWSDQDDKSTWSPAKENTAGEVVLTDGTRIVGAVRSKNAINIWTDNSLWLMQFTGPPFIFKFSQAGTNCGLIGPHAAIDYNGTTYWMGFDNFYANTGQVQVLDCTVRKFVFDNLNTTYYDKVYTGINSEFREIVWLYVSNSSTECDKYVIFNPEDNYWIYGDSFFTTFRDREIFGNTLTTGATTTGNFLFDNEPSGVFTGDGATLVSFIESADFDIDDGNQLMFMNRIIPDFELSDNNNLTLKISPKQYPESNVLTTVSKSIDNTTTKIDFRARGRQARIRVSCESNNAEWEWGSIRLAFQGDGAR